MLINESIRECRISKGITQSELAERLGVSKRFVIYMEQGNRKIPVDRLIQIADIFNCYLDELTGREKRNQHEQD